MNKKEMIKNLVENEGYKIIKEDFIDNGGWFEYLEKEGYKFAFRTVKQFGGKEITIKELQDNVKAIDTILNDKEYTNKIKDCADPQFLSGVDEKIFTFIYTK